MLLPTTSSTCSDGRNLPRRGLPQLLVQLYSDAECDPVLRDYALQHLGRWIEVESAEAHGKKERLEVLKTAAGERTETRAATALLALQRIAAVRPERIDEEEVGPARREPPAFPKTPHRPPKSPPCRLPERPDTPRRPHWPRAMALDEEATVPPARPAPSPYSHGPAAKIRTHAPPCGNSPPMKTDGSEQPPTKLPRRPPTSKQTKRNGTESTKKKKT